MKIFFDFALGWSSWPIWPGDQIGSLGEIQLGNFFIEHNKYS
jgi:hypothetical protein